MITMRKYDVSDEDVVGRFTEPDYYKKFGEFPNNSIYLAIKDDTIVGWLHLNIPDNAMYSCFLFIYVAQPYRRQGIGTYIYSEAEKLMKPSGCNWWSSYPESDAADKFALAVGFDYTNTNSYLEYSGGIIGMPSDGIRGYTDEDFPAAPDIWSNEYADMHIRIGLPYKKREVSEAERANEFLEYRNARDNYFVMEADGKVIGLGALFSDGSGIGALAIDKAYKGRGYGTRLAAFITDECLRRGCTTPSLYCETGNDDALHIYKKLGYVEISRESVAIKN